MGLSTGVIFYWSISRDLESGLESGVSGIWSGTHINWGCHKQKINLQSQRTHPMFVFSFQILNPTYKELSYLSCVWFISLKIISPVTLFLDANDSVLFLFVCLFLFSCSWITFHCVYIPCFLYPFIWRWASWVIIDFDYFESCCRTWWNSYFSDTSSCLEYIHSSGIVGSYDILIFKGILKYCFQPWLL